MSPRYAIYYMPAPGTALATFGASVIGYDAWSGREVPFPRLAAFASADRPAFSVDPARYGFHATLKAPFHLAEGKSEAELAGLLSDYAQGQAPVAVGQLALVEMSRFLALVPSQSSGALAALAADCVTRFDSFRAPLTETDRARRLASPLSDRQKRYLEAWGYPYVLEEFRFHMTLAGPLEKPAQAELAAALGAEWARVAAPLTIDSLALAVQPSRDARFVVKASYPLCRPSRP